MDMCFFAADHAGTSNNPSQKITMEEYLETSITHLCGIRHAEESNVLKRKMMLPIWVGSFIEVALNDDYTALSGETLISTLRAIHTAIHKHHKGSDVRDKINDEAIKLKDHMR